MGLLDDAIRDHLDLKRRRGADPAEVERAEREALGPVRRNRDPGEMLEPSEPNAVHGDLAYDHEDDWAHDPLPAVDEFPAPEAAAPPFDAGVHPGEAAPPPVADLASRPELLDQPDQGAREEWERPEPGAPGADSFDDVPASPARSDFPDETAAFDVAGHLGDEEDGDVLEETPEFLQDTPDHDRLWFEQRPPRDFDFDG